MLFLDIYINILNKYQKVLIHILCLDINKCVYLDYL